MSPDFRPDFQPTRPGILTLARNIVPDESGAYYTSFAPESSGYTTAIIGAGSVVGARMLQTPTVSRLLVGTAATLKEADGAGGWTDRSGAAYGLGAGQRWWFVQFGDESVACSLGEATQKSTTGNFSALAGAPKAKIMLSQQGHLLALNYNDGSANPSGIKWCSQGVSTSWTYATGNSAGTATLRETPGPITAGAEIHDIAVVWKYRSMYVGRRVGGATIWEFKLHSPKVGCVGPEAWASTPVGIIFVSSNGVFKFDGSVPEPVDRGVRKALYASIVNPSVIEVSHDESRGNVFIWIPTASICWCYNYLSDKWSVAYTSLANLGNATFSSFITHVRDANYDDALSLNISAPAFGLRTAHLIISSGQKLVNLSSKTIANGLISVLTSGLLRPEKLGPDEDAELSRVAVQWAMEQYVGCEPASGLLTVTPFSRPSGASGAALSTKTATLSARKRFDLRVVGNTLQAEFAFTDQFFGVADIAYQLNKAGAS